MALVKWEPFRDLATIQERMNRLFDDSYSRYREKNDNVLGTAWAPAVDIYETEDALVLKAELPEVDPKDVDIRIEDNVLYLKGERKVEREVREENFHRVERAYGTFARSFTLPHSVAADSISANYKDGILKIAMPKREESKPKQIRVNVE